jgi:hypothetical protein
MEQCHGGPAAAHMQQSIILAQLQILKDLEGGSSQPRPFIC